MSLALRTAARVLPVKQVGMGRGGGVFQCPLRFAKNSPARTIRTPIRSQPTGALHCLHRPRRPPARLHAQRGGQGARGDRLRQRGEGERGAKRGSSLGSSLPPSPLNAAALLTHAVGAPITRHPNPQGPKDSLDYRVFFKASGELCASTATPPADQRRTPIERRSFVVRRSQSPRLATQHTSAAAARPASRAHPPTSTPPQPHTPHHPRTHPHHTTTTYTPPTKRPKNIHERLYQKTQAPPSRPGTTSRSTRAATA